MGSWSSRKKGERLEKKKVSEEIIERNVFLKSDQRHKHTVWEVQESPKEVTSKKKKKKRRYRQNHSQTDENQR